MLLYFQHLEKITLNIIIIEDILSIKYYYIYYFIFRCDCHTVFLQVIVFALRICVEFLNIENRTKLSEFIYLL